MKTFIFLIIIVILGCYKPSDYDDVEFNKLNQEMYLSFITSEDSIAADGSSSIEIAITISKETKPEFREIELTTTKGFFENDSKTIKIRAKEYDVTNEDKIVAKTKLRSEASIGTASINAKVSYLEQTKLIKFFRVSASTISVESKKFFINQSITNEDTLQAKLSRDLGTPSAGQIVNFLAINNNNDTILNTELQKGYFRNFQSKSNISGISSVIFSYGDTSYTGNLKIIATASLPNGQALIDSSLIQVIK